MRRIEVIVTVHVESHNKFFSDLHLGHIKFFELLLKKECKVPMTLLIERSKDVSSCYADDKPFIDEIRKQNIMEVGLHIHPALSRYTYDEQKQRITDEHNLFTDAFGFAPKSFSGGHWCINNDTVKVISELGIVTDASVVPGCTVAAHNGTIVKYSDKFIKPYWICDNNLSKEAPISNILELPVSVVEDGQLVDIGRAETKVILDALYKMSLSNLVSSYLHMTFHSYDLLFANGKHNYMYDKILLIADSLRYCFDEVNFYTCYNYYLLKKGGKRT